MPDRRTLAPLPLAFVLAALAVAALGAASPLAAAPLAVAPVALFATDEARLALAEVVFAPLYQAAAAPSRVIEQSTGGPVLFRVERQAGALYLEFTRADLNPPRLDSAGTWIIKRSEADGTFVQAKVFLQDDPGCYIRLAPFGDRTSMEVSLFGQSWQRGLLLDASFDSLVTGPLARIERLSSAAVDWSLLAPGSQTAADRSLIAIVDRTRQALRGMHYVDDGAMDCTGRLVTIRDGAPQAGPVRGLNCSGFAKWFVDGFYRPLTGTLTDVESLKERDGASRGNSLTVRYEEERDPWFGLDWSRNLAAALSDARGAPRGGAQRFDVRGVPGFRYVEDIGYPLEQLATILWVLERQSPGAVYLGSINRNSGGDPPVPQHHHLVVLAPFIDATRTFQVAVFENAAEGSVSSLNQRFAGEYIHLVRLEALGTWNPPQVE